MIWICKPRKGLAWREGVACFLHLKYGQGAQKAKKTPYTYFMTPCRMALATACVRFTASSLRVARLR